MCETLMEEAGKGGERPVYRDIRRYYCQYCGICRSKKTIITSHINTHHKEEMEKATVEGDCKAEAIKSNTCEECGVSFKKPAHLLQHMQSHSLEHWIPDKNSKMREAACSDLMDQYQAGRPPEKLHQGRLCHALLRSYVCTVDDCQASYRRKDHLNRHLLLHQGQTFKCSVEGCNSEFTIKGNMTRHVKEFHDGSSMSTSAESQKRYVCPESGCGKVFKFASKLKKHENSHVKLESLEALCFEPGCMKHFSNVQCLRAHIKSCHQYMRCETCGSKQLKKNIKRHLRSHETGSTSETFKCEHKGCTQKFSSKSNLHKHVKAVHFEVKPFMCGFSGCGMRFAYKHVRDNHEKTGSHVYTLGDFVEADEQFRSRPRGGQKRKCPTVEMLVRKRITPPSQLEHALFMQETGHSLSHVLFQMDFH